jgi:hypothetical protein
VSEHLRLGLGTFFYMLHDANPAETDRTLGLAPSFTASVDLDVVQLVLKAYKNE